MIPLVCTTPATIPTSPDLRPFPWYDIYEKYLDSSMAGPSTIQSNDVQSILRSLVIPFDNYEAQCPFQNVGDWIPYEIIKPDSRDWCTRIFFSHYTRRDWIVNNVKEAHNTHDRVFELYSLQKLLESAISKYDRLKNHSHSLSSLDRVVQLLVLWAVILAGNIYRLKGRRGEAINLLEIVIQLVEQHLDMTDSIILHFYTAMQIELAQCYAEDGHCDEARYLIVNKLKSPLTSEVINSTHGSDSLGIDLICIRGYIRFLGLREIRRAAIRLAEPLDNCRADARPTQEHTTRLQEDSSQPTTSDWGPFLTDCIEWDKI